MKYQIRKNWPRLLMAGAVSVLLANSSVLAGEHVSDQASVRGWRAFFPRGSSLAPVPGLKKGEEAYEVRAKDGAILGWVFRTDRLDPEVKGYNDQLGVLVALSGERKIIGLQLVEHKDAPNTVEQIKGGFYGQFRGRPVSDAWKEIDTVTGATISSGAIARDVFLSSRRLFSIIDAGN